MKRVLWLCLYLVLLPSLLIAQSLEEKRRIEEEKREDLRPSEVQIPEDKKKPPMVSPIDLAYFIELMPKKVTFRYDACKVLVILMGVEEQYIDLDSQIAFIKEKNLLPQEYNLEFDFMQPLRKGLVSYMFCKALKIKGGLCLRLFGVNERYALKELVFEGIMFPGNVQDIVSGEELVSVLMLATSYMEKKQQIETKKPKNEG